MSTRNAPSWAPLRPTTHCFAVHAHPDPSVMPRVLELFAKRNLMPDSWHSRLDRGASRAALHIDIQLCGLDTHTVTHIANCLRQIVHVQTVLTSQKGYRPGST